MKLMWIAVPALAATLAIGGCKNRKEEPIPPPNAVAWSTKTTIRLPALPSRVSAPARAEDQEASMMGDRGHGMAHGASGISWFQGSFEEAFSIACSCHCYHFGLKN